VNTSIRSDLRSGLDHKYWSNYIRFPSPTDGKDTVSRSSEPTRASHTTDTGTRRDGIVVVGADHRTDGFPNHEVTGVKIGRTADDPEAADPDLMAPEPTAAEAPRLRAAVGAKFPAAAFTGHGVSFCSAIGETLADLTVDGTIDRGHGIDLFALDRSEDDAFVSVS
jgi:hypothetical protein